PVPTAEGRETTGVEAPLIPPNSACGTTERPRDIILVRPALFYEADHYVGLGHSVPNCILRQRNTRDDHKPRALLRLDDAAIVDGDRRLISRQLRKEVPLPLCSCHGRSLPGPPKSKIARQKKRTGLGSPLLPW